MAEGKICCYLGLAAVLVCLVGTIACNSEDKQKAADGKELQKQLAGSLKPEEVLSKLKEFKWQDFSLGELTVKEASLLSELDVSRCRVDYLKSMQSAMEKYKPRLFSGSAGLFGYIKHYLDRYAKFCLENLASVSKKVLSLDDIKNLDDFVTSFGEGSQSTDKQPDVKEAVKRYLLAHATESQNSEKLLIDLLKSCQNVWDKVFDLSRYLKQQVLEESQERDNSELSGWRHLKNACLKFSEKKRELSRLKFSPTTGDPSFIPSLIEAGGYGVGDGVSDGGSDGGSSSDASM